MTKSAVLSDIVAPSALQPTATGHVRGYATNTGTESMVLYVDMIDFDTDTVIATQGPLSTIPQSPIRTLDIPFVMPSHDLHWFLILREDLAQYDRYPASGYQTVLMGSTQPLNYLPVIAGVAAVSLLVGIAVAYFLKR